MATRDPLTLALVYGSTREGRLCDTLVNSVSYTHLRAHEPY